MASIFEEMMTVNKRLTESRKISASGTAPKKESRKFSCSKVKVESRKIFEENDITDLEDQFDIPEEDTTGEDSDGVVLVIDPEAPTDEEIPEDAAEEMVGDFVYKCPVCGSNYVCDCDSEGVVEGIDVDEEGAPLECPICGDDADQILVGEITPAEDASGDLVEPPAEDVEDNEDFEEDSFSEGTRRKKSPSKKTCNESVDNDDEIYDSVVNTPVVYDAIPEDYKGLFDVIVEFKDGSTYSYASDHGPLKRSEVEVAIGGDLKAYFLDHPKENPRRYKVVPYSSLSEDYDSDVTESPLELSTSQSSNEVEGGQPSVQINNSDVDLYFDEAKLEAYMNKVIRDNYKGGQFTVTAVRRDKSRLKIEYVVRKGKKSLKGLLIGEGFLPRSRTMTVSFKDKGAFTESFGKTPAFVVECVRVKNKIYPTRMRYDYKVKVNESLYRVSGRVSDLRSKK